MIEARSENRIDIKRILESESVIAHFQPIISLRRKVSVGMEALCRGFSPNSDELIPPKILFKSAEEQGLLLELDRLCRRKAFESFKIINDMHSGYLFFVNISTSLVDHGVVGSNFIRDLAHEFSINPGNIVIEIIESRVKNLSELKRFTKNYKEFGFLIAVDDIGSGDSNLSRIHLLEPDILKIDMSIIRGLDKEYYKQEIFRSIKGLSKKIGALVVAEGIESAEEALKAFELGADMFQGYFFAKPKQEIEQKVLFELNDKISGMSVNYRKRILEKVDSFKQRCKLSNAITEEIVEKLTHLPEDFFEGVLLSAMSKYPAVECFYVLDDRGIQCTETIYNETAVINEKRLIFQPAPKQSDHSLKDYYLFLKAGMEKYITEDYISLATGNLCITISKKFFTCGKEYILCFDLNAN